MSDCKLDRPAQDLFLPFAACEHLGSILAARCGLTGDLPTFDPLPPVSVLGGIRPVIRSPLATSLEVLDLSGNNLSNVADMPAAIHSIGLSSNQQTLWVAEGFLTKACKQGVLVDLRGSSLHQNSVKELQTLLEDGVIQNTSEKTYIQSERGYSCYDLDRGSTTLQVTPSKFFPRQWCTCLRGWHGSGVNCEECPVNTYSENTNSLNCSQCPAHTTAPVRADSVHKCVCQVGALHEVDSFWTCGCPRGQAILEHSCVPCRDSWLPN